MKIVKPSYEIMTDFNGEEILKNIEKCGRVCYKSESKIGDGTAEKFATGIIKRGHETVLEHYSFTVKFICDRGVSHELVRHRLASWSQESTRYCVAGDTHLTTTNPHNRPTIESLYQDMLESKNGAWKRVNVRQYNEDSGILEYSKIKNIFKIGEKPCIKIKTRLGYEIVCTDDHKIMIDYGGEYETAINLKIGDSVIVNGSNILYKNRDWLYYQNIVLNKTFKEISDEFGYNISTIKSWARKLDIPKKGRGYFNVGRSPWNKGVRDERQVNALIKYHHCGRRKDKILKADTCQYRKYKKPCCEICGANNLLEVHHMDCSHSNNSPVNLMTLCTSCHMRVHSKNLLTAVKDYITSVEDAGMQEVYDIEMDSNYHNFVGNGVVLHNCNYSKEGFGGEITVIEPFFFEKGSAAWEEWCRAMICAECAYFNLLEVGCTPQEARSVLPNSLKTEVVMTANVREWRHFLKLRTDTAAHPQIREIAIPLLAELKEKIPVVFDDIAVKGEE